MGCMNHISPSENMFKTAPGAKFRGVEKLAWDSWRILMPFRVFSSRHVFIRCLYITYTAGENNVLSRYTTRGNKIIYTTPQGSHRCFAGWILKADVDPGVKPTSRSYIRLETLLEQFCFIRSEPSSVPKRQDNKKLILSWFWLFAVVFSSLKFLSKKGMTTRNHTEQPPDVVASKLDSLSPSPANILNNNIYM